MGNIQTFRAKDLKWGWILTVLFILLSMELVSAHSPTAYRHRLSTLKTHLLRNYSKDFAPFQEAGKPFNVILHFTLASILDLNAADQVLTSLGYLGILWLDPDLAWNSSEAGSPGEHITTVQFTSDEIWTPRLVIVNLADDRNQLLTEFASVVVKETGQCVAQLPLRLRTTCTMDVTRYPFDTQLCKMIFAALYGDNLSLSGSVLNVSLADITDTSGEWQVENLTTVSHSITYQSVNVPLDYVSFYLKIRRNYCFYLLTVIFPMVILSVTGACGFLLPLQCGEKVSFQVAIMVSLSVFLSFINDAMPKTTNSTSRLALYLDLLLLQSCLSLLATLTVLRGHYHLEKLDTLDKETRLLSTPPVKIRKLCRAP